VTDLARLYESAILRWGDGETPKATDLENEVHELQERLWAAGPLGDGTEQLALGVIEFIGGSFETEDAEHAVECLGKAMVCAAGYAYQRGLALSPILDLARALTRRDDVQPVHGVTRLAALERQDLVESHHVVAALGLCIAKGTDDCEIVHGLTIEPHGVFLTIGREMLERNDPKLQAALAEAVTSSLEPAARVRLSKGQVGEWIDGIDRRPFAPVVFDPMRHVSPLAICPQCAALMTRAAGAAGPGSSEVRDTGYRCENGHELTAEQMDALLRASTAPSDGS
jgi:hypothetical protein